MKNLENVCDFFFLKKSVKDQSHLKLTRGHNKIFETSFIVTITRANIFFVDFFFSSFNNTVQQKTLILSPKYLIKLIIYVALIWSFLNQFWERISTEIRRL